MAQIRRRDKEIDQFQYKATEKISRRIRINNKMVDQSKESDAEQQQVAKTEAMLQSIKTEQADIEAQMRKHEELLRSLRSEHKNLQIVMNKEVKEVGPSPRISKPDSRSRQSNKVINSVIHEEETYHTQDTFLLTNIQDRAQADDQETKKLQTTLEQIEKHNSIQRNAGSNMGNTDDNKMGSIMN